MPPRIREGVRDVFCLNEVPGKRQPGADECGTDEVHDPQNDKRRTPMPMGRNQASDKASEESANHGASNVSGHSSTYASTRPFLIDISEHHGNDAGNEDALREA